MRALTLSLLSLSATFSACILLPAPTRSLLPLTVAAPELAAWLILFNLAAGATAWKFQPGLLPFFAISMLISAWPLAQIPGVERRMADQIAAAPAPSVPAVFLRSIVGIPSQRIKPESLPLNILFYHADGEGPRPAIIDIHGGSWQRGAPGDNDRFDRYMASKGYAVFAIGYRYAPADRFPAQIEDVRAAISFLASHANQYGIDPNRLAICGRSAGAQLALLAAYEKGPVPIRAVISFYGPIDLVRGYEDVPSPDPLHVREILEAYLGGSPSRVPDAYRTASPITYATGSLPPTLIIQGSHDHIVKAVFSRDLYSKLRATGNRAVLLELPWAEHAFDAVFFGIGNQLALGYIETFLQNALAG